MTADTGARRSLPRWLIVGAGSFGTAFAHILRDRSLQLAITARDEQHVADMRATRTNERYFPGHPLPQQAQILTFEEAAGAEWDVVVLAVPTRAFRETLERFRGAAPVFISLAKGLDEGGRRISEVADDILGRGRIAVISGPNIAHEIMHDLPTAAVIASTDVDTAFALQKTVTGAGFRLYVNDDLLGVEFAGASKNVVAIAAGICEAAGFGTNGVGSIMTRGMSEVARLGVALGAQLETFLGLAGMGDLITTCMSPHGRNRRAGLLLAQGLTPDQVRSEIGQVVEGLRTAPMVARQAAEHDVEMHICSAVAEIAQHATPLPEIMRQLMSRTPGWEFPWHHLSAR